MFAYIPARGGSKRIPHKNIKQLGDKPIIAHVINALKKLDFIDAIYVSTDDPEIKEVAELYGAECHDLRSDELANDISGFIDLIHKDVPRYSKLNGGDDEVLFVLATAALVPASVYQDAYKVYREHQPQILMSCEAYGTSPFWAMVEKSDGFWEPIFPNKVLTNSQDLPKTLVDAGLFYFFQLSSLMKYESVKIVDKLMPYLVEDAYLGDIDTPKDWQELELQYKQLVEQGIVL